MGLRNYVLFHYFSRNFHSKPLLGKNGYNFPVTYYDILFLFIINLISKGGNYNKKPHFLELESLSKETFF